MVKIEIIRYISCAPTETLKILVEAIRDRCEELSEEFLIDEIADPATSIYQSGILASEAACALDNCQSYIGLAISEQEEVEGRKQNAIK